jgi:hypothetical protein
MLIDNSTEIDKNTDITTKEGWEAYIQTSLEWARNYAQEQELRHMVVLLLQVNPRTQEALLSPRPHLLAPVALERTGNPEDDDQLADLEKDVFVHVCRALSLLGRAIACVTHSEAWLQIADEAKACDPHRPRPKDDPDRKEALIAITEHRDFGSSLYTALITSDQDQRTLGEWESRDGDGMVGRMTGLVPPPELYDHSQIAKAIEAAQELLGCEEVRWSN